MVTHVDGCDGYRYAHLARTQVIPSGGTRGMWQARCDICRWEGTLVGPGAISLAQKEAREHTQEVACDGRCEA